MAEYRYELVYTIPGGGGTHPIWWKVQIPTCPTYESKVRWANLANHEDADEFWTINWAPGQWGRAHVWVRKVA